MFQWAVLLFPVLFWSFVLICHVLFTFPPLLVVSCPFHCVHLCLFCQLLCSLCVACCLSTDLFYSPKSVLVSSCGDSCHVSLLWIFLFLALFLMIFLNWSLLLVVSAFGLRVWICNFDLSFGCYNLHVSAGYQSSLFGPHPAHCFYLGPRHFAFNWSGITIIQYCGCHY